MCHLGTHTHANRHYMAGAHVARPDNCHARSPHAGRLGTGRHHSWRLVDDGDLRTLAASLAALVDDSSNMSWKPSPSTWAWHDGQRRERRRQDEHLQLEAASSGGGGTGRRQDLVVNTSFVRWTAAAVSQPSAGTHDKPLATGVIDKNASDNVSKNAHDLG